MIRINQLLIAPFILLNWSAFSQTAGNSTVANGNFNIVENSNSSFRFKSNLLSNAIQTLNITTKSGNFSELVLDGYGSSNIIGEPQLPVLKQLIEVPLGADFEIELINSTVREYSLKDLGVDFAIIPAQGPISKGGDPSKIEFKYHKEVYATNAFLDRKLVEVIPVGIMRGVRIVRLEISPVFYHPVENKLRIYENIEVQINYKNADLIQTKALKENTYSPYFEASYHMLANHQLETRTDFTRYPVKYVIVSNPMFKTILQPFIKWKTKKGFNVIEAYTDNPSVGTTTTSITSYLKKLYTSGTASDPAPSFILFVGDVAQLPVYDKGDRVTDLYYCEYTGDKLPDVYYGRFSATTVQQLQSQIDKTLEYEQYLMPDPSFLNNAILIAGVDKDYAPKHGNGQINYATETYFNTKNGIQTAAYLYPASSSASSKIIQGVNSGACFVNYTAHGLSSGWADPAFSKSKVPSLTNAHKYPFMIGNCCLTNKFEDSECFGEALLRANTKGAIGYIGASDLSDWDEDYWFAVGYRTAISANPKFSASQLGCFDRAFHTHGEPFNEWYTTQGQILNAGNLAVTQSGSRSITDYWEMYHLMGDPALMPYFSVPLKLSVSYLSPAPVSTTTVEVKTEPYAYAAISLNGVLYGVALADANGLAVIEINKPFASGDAADVVVTKQNRQPYTGKLIIGNTTAITDINDLKHVTVFPNPSTGEFIINGVTIGSTIAIVDLVGRLVYETITTNASVLINLKEQAKGVYFYKVIDPLTKAAHTGKVLLAD